MFSFIAAIFGAVWIQEHWKSVVGVLVALIVLLLVIHNRNKKRRVAYLALPVLYIGNRSTHVVHTTTCPKVSSLSPQNAVAFRSVEEVRRSGYSPCNYCKP